MYGLISHIYEERWDSLNNASICTISKTKFSVEKIKLNESLGVKFQIFS